MDTLRPIQKDVFQSLDSTELSTLPLWNDYEIQKGWIRSDRPEQKDFKTAMKSDQRWAITAPEVKGAVGLVLYALLAYFPGLCFTNISHHDENTSDEVRNNRAMAMLPSHHSVAMFSLLEQTRVKRTRGPV